MSGRGLEEGTVICRYEIGELIGAGGMGEVYSARDRTLDRTVALKVLPPSLTSDPRRVERFTTEARAASSLNHPAIVAMYEIGESQHPATGEPLHFIAMELIDGETFDEWLASSPAIPQILSMLSAIARGLGRVHARGIVHRDLKPENIMVSAGGLPKILDFGIAKLLEARIDASSQERSGWAGSTLTQPSSVMGTVGYMSPEQVEGAPLDHRSDIFSLGCILYESVAGKHPFVGETRAETLHRIVNRDSDPIELASEDLRIALQRVLDRCLAKNPEFRYDSASDLALDLDEVLRIEGGGAVSITGRKRRTSGVRRATLILVAALALIGLPIVALVDSVMGGDLLEELNQERGRTAELGLAMEQHAREIAQKDLEIERLKSDRTRDDARRADLEESYRQFVIDMTQQVRGDESERARLRERLDQAESELNHFRSAEVEQRRVADLRGLAQNLSSLIAVRSDDRSVTATIPGVVFSTGASRPAIGLGAVIQLISDNLTKYPELKLTIEGHADSNGPAIENQLISEQRAESIREQLVAFGVDISRITTVGHGELRPLVSNDTVRGRTMNRRAELVFTY